MRYTIHNFLVDILIKNLSAIVGPENVLTKADELLVYECDGLPHHKYRPRAVVFPSSTEQVSLIMKVLADAQVPFTPRGAGTGLSGGALALNQGVVIELARMRKILSIDKDNRLAVVQPGVVNLQVSKAVAPLGLYYVPDPSSQPTCTIGGNIAESAGGIHCLKYGTTTDHILGCRVVLAGGEVVDLGGAGLQPQGYDLLGTFIGSEGTFGIATEATLRLSQTPPTVRTLLAEFREVNDASHAVSAIIAAGVMPAALEMMDHEIIRAVEASVFAAGLPPDAGAALLIELDGIEAGIDDEAARVTDICMEFGARSCRAARDETERKKLWAARKGAFGAIGRISPDSMIQDAVVPRSRLPEVLSSAYEIANRYELRMANVFHAGDGNLHPLICFDSRFPDQVTRVKEAGRELMEVCVAAGGTITGEHGVGLDKRELLPLVFSDADMNAMLRVRAAFDPYGICNPGKIVPMLRGCGEGRAVTGLAQSSAQDAQSVSSIGDEQSVDPCATPQPGLFSDQAIGELEAIVGVENVLCSNETVEVSPASTAETAEIIKLAAGNGWKVIPAGSLKWFNADTHSQLVINTTRMNQIIEHEPADLIAVAQAGVRLKDFNEHLARNGQWLPLDPPDNGQSTLGGIVATGIGGCQQYAYGRPRGSVIGMKVVLADGTVIKAGGRVVKNVAGYDLCKLFTGSYGSLGIITEINFKLRPRPVQERTIVVTGLRGKLIEAAHRILNDRLFPVALELLSTRLAQQMDLEIKPGDSVLLIRFAGYSKGVEWQIREATETLTAAGLGRRVLSEDSLIWQQLAAFPLQFSQTQSIGVTVLPDRSRQLIDTIAELSPGLFELSFWQLGIADGRLQLVTEPGHSQEVSRAIVSAGGKLIVPGVDYHGASIPLQRLHTRIKQQLDPYHLFWVEKWS